MKKIPPTVIYYGVLLALQLGVVVANEVQIHLDVKRAQKARMNAEHERLEKITNEAVRRRTTTEFYKIVNNSL